MHTIRESILHKQCDLCSTDGHRVLYFAPVSVGSHELDWPNMCNRCFQINCLKDSDEGIKWIDDDVVTLPEGSYDPFISGHIISAGHPECPSCHIVHDVQQDAECSFRCYGCGTPLVIEAYAASGLA